MLVAGNIKREFIARHKYNLRPIRAKYIEKFFRLIYLLFLFAYSVRSRLYSFLIPLFVPTETKDL